jgi:hypothetical protein
MTIDGGSRDFTPQTRLVAEVLHGLEALTAGGTGRKPIVVVVAG